MNASRLLLGSSLILKGWGFLRMHPSLWAWVLIPWILDLTVLILGWVWGLALIKSLLASTLAAWTSGGWVMDLLYYPLLFIFTVGFFVLWLFLVMAIASVVAAPFNSLLAEKALKIQNQSVVEHFGFSIYFRHLLRMLGISLLKALLFILVGLILFGVSFIPGLNLVAGYFSMCLFAADVFDYGFEAKGFSLSQRFQAWRQFRPEVMGLGVTLSLTSILPGFTVFCLPLAVVGATTLFKKTEKG